MPTKRMNKLAAKSKKLAAQIAAKRLPPIPPPPPDVPLLSRWDLTAFLEPDPEPPAPPLQDFLVDPRDGVWRNRRS